VQQRARNLFSFGGINEAEIQQVDQQNFPVLLHKAQQSLPIDFLVLEQYEMRNIGTIVAATILNENLGPNQIGHGRDLHFIIKESCRARVLEPVVRHGSNHVRRAEYDIDVKFALKDLRNPTLVIDPCLVPERTKSIQDLWVVTSLNENIDVFGGAPKFRVVINGKPSSHHEREFGVFQRFQNFGVEGMSRGYRLIPHNFSIEKVTKFPGIYREAGFCL
jgi:hypothetical protein